MAASASLPGYRRAGAVWVARTPLPPAAPLRLTASQLTQHGLQDAAVYEVGDLVGGVEANGGGELLGGAVLGAGGDGNGARPAAFEVADVEALLAAQAEALDALAVGQLKRQDTPPDQIGAVDALEAPRDHRSHAEQVGALGCPVARRARSVLLARQH